ncbi:MAG: carboxypeptidase regulatory-like domain-containing protein, partial [Spirochaetes bacterium]|nr:carboxypeptidase regulatory-like domain-containing protein [Spirochaetota bacterium]
MKKKLLILGGALLLVFAFTGCQFLVAMLTSISGTVVDARSAKLTGLSGVSITMTLKSDTAKTYTGKSDSSGNFTITNVDPGEYKIAAVLNGWFFPPKDVYVGGMAQDLGKVLGIEMDQNTNLASSALSFILVWNEVYKDVDAHLTYVKGDGNGGPAVDPGVQTAFTKPNQDYSAIGLGFGPDSTGNREHISWENIASLNTVRAVMNGDTSYPNEPAVTLDRDDTNGSGPEVITVRTIPYWPAVGYSTGITPDGTDSGNYLPKTDPDGVSVAYAWVGVMEYYIDGYDKDGLESARPATGSLISSADSSADAVVYTVKGNELIGKFIVPDFANIRTADMIRINLFVTDTDYSYF